MASVRCLRRDEAVARAQVVSVVSYDVALDLTGDLVTFRSTTRIVLDSPGGRTFLQVQPVTVHELSLDGEALPADAVRHGRLPLDLTAGRHEVTVDADLAYRTDGEGLHRSNDPADGRSYVYAMTFLDAAPTVFACFDQPDLKAPLTLRVAAPEGWVVLGNAPLAAREGVWWHFEPTPPLATYLMGLVAGPYHVVRDEHDGIPLSLSARASLAADLEAQADDLLTVTRQSFDEMHRLFGVRYAFGGYHQAFVPDFNAGAMESPGCVTFRDPLLFTSRVTRAERITRAVTIAHELAHQWFGNLTSPVWWDDLWLNESFAEYLGTRVVADATQYADAWVLDAHSRRPWGMAADLRPSTHPVAGAGARDTDSALLDFDGISYAKGAAVLRQLNAAIGDEAFFGGAVDHFGRHWFGNGTMADLLESWERVGAPALSAYVEQWLSTAGADTLAVDRHAQALTCTAPAEFPARRRHHLHVAVAAEDGTWVVTPATTMPPRTPLVVPVSAPVLVDAYAETWAVSHLDDRTQEALAELTATTDDPRLRAGIWSAVRSTFHDGLMDPERAVEIVAAATATEDVDHMLRAIGGWMAGTVIPLCDDPSAAAARLHPIWLERCRSAGAGSGLQLAAFHGAVATAVDAAQLLAWTEGRDLAPGVLVDENLLWRILGRRAALGLVDAAELDSRLAAAPTATAEVDHARAVASLPDAATKAWAWAGFRGERAATTYALEACGEGLWQVGQEHLTDAYVDRYFAELAGTSAVRHGVLLGLAAEWFFPHTSVSPRTLDQSRALLAQESLAPALRRAVVDQCDDLARRVAVRSAFGGS